MTWHVLPKWIGPRHRLILTLKTLIILDITRTTWVNIVDCYRECFFHNGLQLLPVNLRIKEWFKLVIFFLWISWLRGNEDRFDFRLWDFKRHAWYCSLGQVVVFIRATFTPDTRSPHKKNHEHAKQQPTANSCDNESCEEKIYDKD